MEQPAGVTLYTDALAELLPRTVPLVEALREAAQGDPECRQVFGSLRDRRAANMRLFAADLRSTGQLRESLDDDLVADVLWSMNDPDYYLLLRSRGRTAREYADLVRDIWIRTLLR